jgi:site-specific recombinase XerD
VSSVSLADECLRRSCSTLISTPRDRSSAEYECRLFRPRNSRHTYASRLTMSGAGVRTVAELLRDLTLIMATRYSHLAPDFTQDAVTRMEAKFQTPDSTTTAPGTIGKPVRVK